MKTTGSAALQVLLFILVLLLPLTVQGHMFCSKCSGKCWQLTSNNELQCANTKCNEVYSHFDIYSSFACHRPVEGVEGYHVYIKQSPVSDSRDTCRANQLINRLNSANTSAMNLLSEAGVAPEQIIPIPMLTLLISTYTTAEQAVIRLISLQLALLSAATWSLQQGNQPGPEEHQLQMLTILPFLYLTTQHASDNARNYLVFSQVSSELEADSINTQLTSITQNLLETPAQLSDLTLNGLDHDQAVANLIIAFSHDTGFHHFNLPPLGHIVILMHPDNLVTLITDTGVYVPRIPTQQLARLMVSIQNRPQYRSLIYPVIGGVVAVSGELINLAAGLYTGSYLRHLIFVTTVFVATTTAAYLLDHYLPAPSSQKPPEKKKSSQEEDKEGEQ
ncbi:MAG: hypothetical protein ACR2PX_06585 [Endozoicomonas sp.]|uniref:hypothetical protein n=1 Tax=Endozoicomonas sp. TaxID=1892382 RepID=UPI003D9B9FDD